MKKLRLVAIFATILTVFFIAQSATAMMEETEGVAREDAQLYSIGQVELYDTQTEEMVNLVDLIEDRATLIAFLNLSCVSCVNYGQQLALVSQSLPDLPGFGEKYQIIVIMVPQAFVLESVPEDFFKKIKVVSGVHLNIFVDADGVTAKNITYLGNRFFVSSFPTTVMIETDGDSDFITFTDKRGDLTFLSILSLMREFSDGYVPRMKEFKGKLKENENE